MSQRTAVLIGVFAIVVLAVSGFWYARSIQPPSATPTPREGPAAWKTYQYVPYAFEMQYPAGWGVTGLTNTLGYHNVVFVSSGRLDNLPVTGDYYLLVVSRSTPVDIKNALPSTSPGQPNPLETGKSVVLGSGIQGVELDTTPDIGPNEKTVYIQKGGFVYYLNFQVHTGRDAQTGGDPRRVPQHGQFSPGEEELRQSILRTFRFLE